MRCASRPARSWPGSGPPAGPRTTQWGANGRRQCTRAHAHRRVRLCRTARPMPPAWIVLATLAGGVLSVFAAAFALVLRPSWVPMLVSFAIGTLLGAAFLEVLPHAFGEGNAHAVAVAILGGH